MKGIFVKIKALVNSKFIKNAMPFIIAVCIVATVYCVSTAEAKKISERDAGIVSNRASKAASEESASVLEKNTEKTEDTRPDVPCVGMPETDIYKTKLGKYSSSTISSGGNNVGSEQIIRTFFWVSEDGYTSFYVLTTNINLATFEKTDRYVYSVKDLCKGSYSSGNFAGSDGADMYNVYDYDDAEDFEDIDDAEDYFYEHNG